MREKIKKILIFSAEIITIAWAVNGVFEKYYSVRLSDFNPEYYFTPVLAYFLSAVLILYLLREYRKNN